MGKFALKAAVAAILTCVPMQSVAAPFYTPSNVVTVRGDRGGVILKYALQVKKLEQRGSLVRLGGSCDSACTLYLGLPSRQVCLLRGATFRFHLPFGSTKRNNQIAANYLMRTYPGWVRSWINSRGGLTGGLKTMSYAYAAKYVRPCENDKRRDKKNRWAATRQLGR